MMNRRDFLKAITLASAAPLWIRLGSSAAYASGAEYPTPERLLLVIWLAGGNDGLNTVVPYLDSVYKNRRPTIGFNQSEVLDLGGSHALGLHPSLQRVHQMWTQGQAAIVHNVGYPNPNFSHFESTHIWETASPDGRFHTGWLGRYLDATDSPTRGPVRAVAVGSDTLPRTLVSAKGGATALTTLSDFGFADGGRADSAARRAAYNAFGIGRPADGSMRTKILDAQVATSTAVDAVADARKAITTALTPAETVATMFAAGVGTEIGFIFLGGFDTHTTQRPGQASSLTRVDNAIAQFFDAAARLGIADRATVLTFSDFGRRLEENASNGTDHGSSMPMLVLGPRVRGGVYGARPDLTDLDQGNLKPGLHFNTVYGSVMADAFNVDPDPLLGGAYPRIPLIG